MHPDNVGQQLRKYWSPDYGSSIPKFYHGSGKEFKPGDVIDWTSRWEPERKAGLFSEELDSLHGMGYAAKTHHSESFNFVSPSPSYAAEYAYTKPKHHLDVAGPGHVYEVEPIHPDSLVHLTPDEVGSPHGFRVVRKLDPSEWNR